MSRAVFCVESISRIRIDLRRRNYDEHALLYIEPLPQEQHLGVMVTIKPHFSSTCLRRAPISMRKNDSTQKITPIHNFSHILRTYRVSIDLRPKKKTQDIGRFGLDKKNTAI